MIVWFIEIYIYVWYAVCLFHDRKSLYIDTQQTRTGMNSQRRTDSAFNE